MGIRVTRVGVINEIQQGLGSISGVSGSLHASVVFDTLICTAGAIPVIDSLVTGAFGSFSLALTIALSVPSVFWSFGTPGVADSGEHGFLFRAGLHGSSHI